MPQKSVLHRAISVGLLPVTLLGGVLLVSRGLSLGYHPTFVTSSVSVVTALLCLGLERLIPFAPDWNRPRGDIGTNFAHFFFSMIVVIALFQLLAFGPIFALGRSIEGALGFALWPTRWPLWGQLVLALVVAELGYYWLHRLSHEIEFLWRFHATHHSLPRLYWLNGGHFHPVDTLFNYAAEVTPLLLLGAGPEVLALFSAFTGINGMLKHSNIDLRLGPLNWILSTADLHRWHHSKEHDEGNTNYGSNLILWDLLFKTRFLPKDRRPPLDIGLSGMPHFPEKFVAQLRSPFEWEKTKLASQ